MIKIDFGVNSFYSRVFNKYSNNQEIGFVGVGRWEGEMLWGELG